eukprot:COSAG01_NODE_192_length_22494_cov_100.193384_5_plen_60_part_00
MRLRAQYAAAPVTLFSLGRSALSTTPETPWAPAGQQSTFGWGRRAERPQDPGGASAPPG